MTENSIAFTPLRMIVPWPEDIFPLPEIDEVSLLDLVGIRSVSFHQTAQGSIFDLELIAVDQTKLQFLSLEGFSIVVGSDTQLTFFEAELVLGQNSSIALEDIDLAIEISSIWFKPVRLESGRFVRLTNADGSTVPLQINLQNLGVEVGLSNGNLELNLSENSPAVQIYPFEIGDTGIILELSEIAIHFSDSNLPPDVDLNWRGIWLDKANVYFPESVASAVPPGLFFTQCAVGRGGFSGQIITPLSHQGACFGLLFNLDHLSLSIEQNALNEASIKGNLELPFWDKRVEVEISLDMDGGAAVHVIGSREHEDTTTDDGLLVLRKEDLLEFTVESIGIEFSEGLASTILAGDIRPLVGGLDWPGFRIDALAIDSEGNVEIEGGWINLPDQYQLDFHGFQLDITQFGMGRNEDGSRWIGLNGGLRLLGDLPAGASVEGLRITWDENELQGIRFDGIDLEFEIPNVLRFSGQVAYVQDGDDHRFEGAIALDLIALKLQIDAKLVVGRTNGYTYLAIYVGAELPAGIPLATTGLAFYGLAGLYAQHMEPGKTAAQQWYSLDRANSWYHSGEQPGVAVLSKWEPQHRSMALGAGITLGTVSDNGFAFNGKLLLAVLLPGPIILLEGRANLVTPRADLDAGEPTFRTLAVLDNREDSLLFGLDAQYKFDSEKGRLVDIRAGAEAFYSFSDPLAWYCYLGKKEPRDQRIAARMYSLFEATAYYMLDAQRLQLGAAIGYDLRKSAGPLSVELTAWIEAAAVLNWVPAHFFGELLLHGTAQLSAFGVGLGLSIDARVAADVFDPLHIIGTLSVALKTPPFLPDPEMNVTVEWGPIPDPPPLPLPLKSVSIEHFKTSTKWPLPRSQANGTGLLRPNYEAAATGYRVTPQGSADLPPLEQIPVVPVDARPHLTFAQPVDDVAQVGVNPAPVGWVVMGDPEKGEGPVKARYSLTEIVLEKQLSGGWITVAKTPAAADNYPTLFGSWAPVPPLPLDAEATQNTAHTPVKLWLWAKNPFVYTLNTGRDWEDWFLGENTTFPCVNVPRQQTHTYDFEDAPLNTPLEIQQKEAERIWQSPDRVTLRWPQTIFEKTENGKIRQVDPRISARHSDGLIVSLRSLNLSRALAFEFVQFDEPLFLDIELPRPHAQVTLVLFVDFSAELVLFGLDADGLVQAWTQQSVSTAGLVTLAIAGTDLQSLRLYYNPLISKNFHILQLVGTAVSPELIRDRQRLADHLQAQTQRWGQVGTVLEPHQTYRLKVTTQITARGEKKLAGYKEDLEQVEFAYFRTGVPPAAAATFSDRAAPESLSIPIGHPNPPQFASGLDDLCAYVEQTIPATVTSNGLATVQARPVYRAYDVGVRFNEDYVELMYRQTRRDLGLYLFDNNGRPVRDSQGRILPMNNRWGNTDALSLSDRDVRWVETLKSRDCVSMSAVRVPHSSTLTACAAGQLLRPSTAYEARLVPMLLHETFDGIALNGWRSLQGSRNQWSLDRTTLIQGAVDRVEGMTIHLTGAPDLTTVVPGMHQFMFNPTTTGLRPAYRIIGVDADTDTVMLDGEPALLSDWSYQYEITQPSAVQCRASATRTDAESVRSGAVLVYGDETWTDYRFSVYVRSASTGAEPAPKGSLGVVFRQQGDRYYRYALYGSSSQRQLAKIEGASVTVLAEEAYQTAFNRDYQLTIEAVGGQLRVYQDGVLVFDVVDSAFELGAIGLYAWSQGEVAFKDVRVDNLRASTQAAYRFSFITSRYANFYHHIHSYLNETWSAAIDTNAISPAMIRDRLAHSTTLTNTSAAPSDEEALAYEALAQAAIGLQTRTLPDTVEATRVQYGEDTIALLLRSPEPIDWSRTTLKIARSIGEQSYSSVPGSVKITDVSFGQGADEGIALVIRDQTSLAGVKVEYRHGLPSSSPTDLPGSDGAFNALLLNASFDTPLDETWAIVDEAPYAERPSRWEIVEGELVQSQNYYGLVGGAINAPGTYIVTGSANWTDYRVVVRLRSDDDDAIGIICRYVDDNNYYRFSMDRQRAYRRLTKKRNGATTVLWEDATRYDRGKTYDVQIDCQNDRLKGTLNGELLFDVTDATHRTGQVGLYCRANRATHFEHMRMFTSLSKWTPYHTFDEETQWLDGTIFQLRSVASSIASRTTEHRIANALSDRSTAFSRYGTHIRLVAPDGSVIHALYAADTTPTLPMTDLRLLRKTDGTAFAVVHWHSLSIGESPQNVTLTPLELGTYWLSFTFRRDNRAQDDGSLVLMQNGVSSPEIVRINISWETVNLEAV